MQNWRLNTVSNCEIVIISRLLVTIFASINYLLTMVRRFTMLNRASRGLLLNFEIFTDLRFQL